ncbi:hypothetical protein, partial [Stenotrophomonas sp. 3diitr2024]|uniref:hypothetical protein n=1 Tax=Stenotrophomonas sp. 3diitr2024 TaxID=3345115 RepID=UPI0035CC4671
MFRSRPLSLAILLAVAPLSVSAAERADLLIRNAIVIQPVTGHPPAPRLEVARRGFQRLPRHPQRIHRAVQLQPGTATDAGKDGHQRQAQADHDAQRADQAERGRRQRQAEHG